MPLEPISERWTKGTHLGIRELYGSESGKTKVYQVLALDEHGTALGMIRWFGRWRKYAFYPEADRVFEQTCLREIAEFCETATRAQRCRKAA